MYIPTLPTYGHPYYQKRVSLPLFGANSLNDLFDSWVYKFNQKMYVPQERDRFVRRVIRDVAIILLLVLPHMPL